MKKLIALLLALVMVFALVACGGEDTTAQTPAPSTDDAAEPAPAPADEPEEPAETEAPETPAEPEETPAEASGDREVPDLVPATVTLSDSKGLEGKRIGCTIVYKGDEWCYQTALALETLGKYYGAEITVEDGDANDETQTKQIENMVANGVDILMVDPLTPDGSHEALMQAYDAGIPIIIYDGYWSDGDEKAVSTITWDQHETGCIVGRYFVDYVKENYDGKARVVELSNMLSTHCQERFVGLHEIIDEANANGCEIEILNMYDSQGNRELAYNAIAAVVEPYDFIISDVDNGAQGATAALQAAGNTSVKVLCMGIYGQEPFGMLHDEDPNYLAGLNVDAWVLGQATMQAALDYFDGKTPDKLINIDLFMVDSSNVEDFWSFD